MGNEDAGNLNMASAGSIVQGRHFGVWVLDIDVQALVNVNFKSIGITDPRDRVKPRHDLL